VEFRLCIKFAFAILCLPWCWYFLVLVMAKYSLGESVPQRVALLLPPLGYLVWRSIWIWIDILCWWRLLIFLDWSKNSFLLFPCCEQSDTPIHRYHCGLLLPRGGLSWVFLYVWCFCPEGVAFLYRSYSVSNKYHVEMESLWIFLDMTLLCELLRRLLPVLCLGNNIFVHIRG
jgi:hypothetical protein